MSLVNIVNVLVLDNPSAFTNPFQFEITFECLQALSSDIEWKVVYVGSAEDPKYDQVLEEVMVGPVPVGINKFVLQAPSPDFSKIPTTDVLGVTVVLVICSYLNHEFVRIGYYVNNEYADPIDPEQPLPNPLLVSKIYRNILADQPRVTRFPIDWTGLSYTQQTDGSTIPLPIELSAEDHVPAEDDEIDMDTMGEDDEDDDDEEDDDPMREEDLSDEEDEGADDGEEGVDMHESSDAMLLNEDSMDVAGMQAILHH